MERLEQLTLGSLFDGSGGFPLAGILAGIQPVWASEIEPFPIRVTTKRMPSVKHYGDVSKMNGGTVEPVDIITFGSPCQDMSVAGKRAGLDGSRSNLFYEAVRIVSEMRCATDGKYPRWICWENVPGAFSSNAGDDFKAVLEAVCKVKDESLSVPEHTKWGPAGEILGNGFSVAWRVLDAQFWGVPQRRKRIFLVADFAGGSAGQILFESEGLSGYTPQGFSAWQGIARSSAACVGKTGVCADGCGGIAGSGEAEYVVLNDQGGSRMDVTNGCTSTLRAEAHHPPCLLESAGFCTEHSAKARSVGYEKELSPTLRAGVVPAAVYENPGRHAPKAWDGTDVSPTLTANNAGGNQRMPDKDNFNCVVEAYGVCSKESNSMRSDNPASGFYRADSSRCLDGNGGNPTCNQGGIAVVERFSRGQNRAEETVARSNAASGQPDVYAMTTGSFPNTGENVAPSLLARDYKDAAVVTEPVYGIDRAAYNQGQNAAYKPAIEENLQPTMVAKGPGAVAQPRTGTAYTVRRLTPTECARLQGFPDGWCADLATENPTYGDIDFWTDVFETHRILTGSKAKPKTGKQIVKWLKNPYSDAAEYKMWGNGVALPCVFFVLAGIVWAARNTQSANRFTQ